MSRYILSRNAENDVAEIWNYIAEEDSPDAADSMLDEFCQRFARLSRMPRLGAVHPDLEGEIRFVVVAQYVVLYKEREEDVLIVRVLHGRRDIRQMFRDEPIDGD